MSTSRGGATSRSGDELGPEVSASSVVEGSTAALGARSQILSVEVEQLELEAGRPIQFDAVVVLVPTEAGYWDGLDSLFAGAVPFDVVPDTGIEADGVGPGRLRYGTDHELYRFRPWSMSVVAGGGRRIQVDWLATAPMRLGDAYVVAYPANAPGPADLQSIELQLGTGRPTGTHPKYLSAVFRGGR